MKEEGTSERASGTKETRELASATRVANAFPDKLTSDLDALRGRPPVVPLLLPLPSPPSFPPKTSISSSLSRPPSAGADPPPGDAQRTTTPLLLAAAKLVNRVS